MFIAVVSLLLSNSNENHPSNIRIKRHEDGIEVETRGRWRKKHRNHGGHGQQQNYPSGFGGGPAGSGSQSSANSQSSAWGQGGASGILIFSPIISLNITKIIFPRFTIVVKRPIRQLRPRRWFRFRE